MLRRFERKLLGGLALALVVGWSGPYPGPVAGVEGQPSPGEVSPGSSPGLGTAAAGLPGTTDYRESERVRLVLLPTSVTDRKGRIVQGLDRGDFRLYEDQVPQEIRYFSSEARDPISVAFVLDVSGSMRQLDKLEHAKEAIRFFLRHFRNDDLFALIAFADEQVDWITDFTDDRVRFRRRLMVQEGFGRTALNDVIAAAPQLVDERIKGRKAIVLITDGVDNASELTTEEAVEIARRVNVPIYTIGFLSVPEATLSRRTTETNLEILRLVADHTGGRLFAVHSPVELKEAVFLMETELRLQYLIGYYPARTRSGGAFHRIRLEVDRRGLNVRTRNGYYD